MRIIEGIEPAKHIKLDIFPAEVSHESEQHGDGFRVIVTDTHLYALEETGSGVKVRFKVPAPEGSFAGSNKDGYTVEDPDGTWSFSRAGHCGCGSRLRGVHPFPGVPHISQL